MKRNENQQLVALLRREAKIESFRRNFPAFFSQQLYVRPEIGPVIRPQLRFSQRYIEQAIEKQLKQYGWIRLVEFKVRQHGGSLHAIGRASHRTYLNENISALIVAQDDSTASNLFRMAELAYEGMDQDIRPVRRYLTKQQIVLENPDIKSRAEHPGLRSRLDIQSATNIHAGVGTTRNWLHLSEMCRFGNAVKDLMGSLIPAIPLMPGTAIIYESAPFGWGAGREEFKAACEAARSGKSPFIFVQVFWWMVEKYVEALAPGEKFRRTATERMLAKHIEQIAQKEFGMHIEVSDEQLKFRRTQIWLLGNGDHVIGEQLFAQQYCDDYDNAWNNLDLSAFDRIKLQTIEATSVIGPRRRCEVLGDQIIDAHGDAPLWIWENPQPGEIYDIGCDPSPGNPGSLSHTAFQVIKRSNNEQVAEFESYAKPMDTIQILMTVGMYYNAAQIAVEVENVGSVVDEGLKQDGYPNVYRWRYRNHIVPTLSVHSGWKTQFDTKKTLIVITDGLLDRDEVIIHSIRLLNQLRHMKAFITDSGGETYDVDEGSSDLAMAYMIAMIAGWDEKKLDMPMSGDESKFGMPTTLAERNQRLLEGINQSLAFCDTSQGKSMLLSEGSQKNMMDAYRRGQLPQSDEEDPFDKLISAMKGER